MTPNLSRHACIGLVSSAALALAAVCFAQTDIGTTLADMKVTGPPSRIALAQGQRKVRHSHRAYTLEADSRDEEAKRHRALDRQRVAQLESQIKTYRQIVPRIASRGKAKLPHPVPTPVAVVDVPYQNLDLTFVNPRQAPVAGVHLVATVHPRDGQDVVLNALVTDNQGRVKLAKVGPLPVSVDIALASDPAPGAEEPEWRLADAQSASLLIPHGLGPKVAAYAGAPYQVASLRPVAAHRRTVVYEYQQPSPVTVERTVADLDLAALPGSTVTTPALGDQPLVVPDTGHLHCRLPLSSLQNGPVPIRVASALPAGEAEAIVSDYTYDPYQVNAIAAPTLWLVRITKMAMTGAIGVMARQDQVVQTFGDLQKQDRGRSIVHLDDGSQVWNYPQQGISFKLRPSPFPEGRDFPAVVERIRLTSVQGGSIGGVTVGSRAEDVAQAFGAPESENVNVGEPGTTENYMDQGVRICEASGRVRWIEVARPTDLLAAGTTAFVPRGAANLYVEDYHGDRRTSISSLDDLKAYLAKLPSVRVVDAKDKADLVLNAGVTGFQSQKAQVFSGLPYKYSCTAKLAYSLYVPDTNQYAVRNKEVEASAGADYTKEALIGAGVVGTAAVLSKNIWGKLLAAAAGGVGVVALNQAVQRAANRCPGIASRTVFDSMVRDINQASDFSVRMTSIDYGTGRMQFNVGTAGGIHPSTPDNPCEFEVMVGGRPLPAQEDGNSADYYTAEVVAADEQSCTCELHHVKRRVDRGSERMDDSTDTGMARRIPDPATGLVSARASVRFPSLPVITDTEVQAADQQAAAAQDAPPQTPPQDTTNGSNANGDPPNVIGSLLDKVFGKKKAK